MHLHKIIWYLFFNPQDHSPAVYSLKTSHSLEIGDMMGMTSDVLGDNMGETGDVTVL